MPFLRFTRDRRGYESTCVLHTYRRGRKQHSRILYWFRTPPHVKVGRLPLDEDAIRAIEEANPDLTFDWPKMLKLQVKPPEPAPVREGRRPRAARIPAEEPLAETGRLPAGPPVATVPSQLPPGAEAEPAPSSPAEEGLAEAAQEPEAPQAPEEASIDVLEEAAAEMPGGPPHPVVQLIGEEGLARLRALYAELQARIAETVPDPTAHEMLRIQSEALNPDTWATEEEARRGLEQFERQREAFRARLGRRPRRSRRGGRRRRRDARRAEPLTSAPTGQPAGEVTSSAPASVGQERETAPTADDSAESRKNVTTSRKRLV
jgi:hypothetical protein